MHSEGKLISKITIPKDNNSNRKVVKSLDIQKNINYTNRYNIRKIVKIALVIFFIISLIVILIGYRNL